MTDKRKALGKRDAIAQLSARGAALARREDRHGEIKTGWWLGGVYLAPKGQPVEALRVIGREVSCTLTLFDDPSVKEKLTIMSKWEAVIDDERNSNDFEEQVEALLTPGKRYQLVLRELPEGD